MDVHPTKKGINRYWSIAIFDVFEIFLKRHWVSLKSASHCPNGKNTEAAIHRVHGGTVKAMSLV